MRYDRITMPIACSWWENWELAQTGSILAVIVDFKQTEACAPKSRLNREMFDLGEAQSWEFIITTADSHWTREFFQNGLSSLFLAFYDKYHCRTLLRVRYLLRIDLKQWYWWWRAWCCCCLRWWWRCVRKEKAGPKSAGEEDWLLIWLLDHFSTRTFADEQTLRVGSNRKREE